MRKKAVYILAYALCTIAGAGLGLSVNVLMVRGVPVINGGGELLMLAAIPASILSGFLLGRKRGEPDR